MTSATCQCGCGSLVVNRFRRGHHNKLPSYRAAISWGRARPPFDSYVKVVASGCHEWQGRLTTPGYGVFHAGGRRWGAHRFVFTRANGPIPEGLFVCHRCDNRRCVNLEHLFLGTCGDNLRDMHNKGRWIGKSEQKTHCKNDHPFNAENTKIIMQPNGKPRRECKTCRIAIGQRWRTANLELFRLRDRERKRRKSQESRHG